MACANGQIVSAVLAPNGEPSQLYASLLKAVKGDQDKALNMFLMTKTIEFKEWFGDSKMVDANGEPLVVYHGSMGDAIENNQFKDDTLFFAEDEESYKGGGTTSVIEPVFIKAERLITPSIPLLGYMPNSTEKMDDVSNPAWYKSLKIVDAVGGIEHKTKSRQIYAVFNKKNVKSVFNKGKFSDTANIYDELSEDEQLAIEALKEEVPEHVVDERLDKLSEVIKAQIETLTRRLGTLRALAKDTTLSKTDRLKRLDNADKLETLLGKLKTLETKSAFVELIKYSKAEMSKILTFLDDKFDVDNVAHDAILIQIGKQMQTFGGLRIPEFAKTHTKLAESIAEINSMYNQVNSLLPEKIEEYMVNFISKNSKNEKYSSVDDIKRYLKEGKDIDFASAWFGDTSSSVDTILALVDKLRKEKLEEITEANKAFASRVLAEGRKLLAAGVKNFDWMLAKNPDGSRAGGFIERIGKKYKEHKDSLFNALKDANGDFRVYIREDHRKLTEEEKEHNIQLWKDKSALSNFLRPEEVEEGEAEDGTHHRYSDEFKAERAKFEVLKKGNYGWQWVKKHNVDEKEYELYLKQYYTPERETYVMKKTWVKNEIVMPAVSATGELSDFDEELFNEHLFDSEYESNSKGKYVPTGEVEMVMRRFVRSQYVEVQEQWNEPEFDTIMQGEKAKRDFYEFYVKEYAALLNKLPIDVARRMEGKVFRIKSDFIERATEGGLGMFRTFLNSAKKLVLPDIYSSGRLLDENGHAVDDIGMFFVGDVYSEERIEKIEERLNELKGTKVPEELREIKRLKRSLKVEKNKVKADELEYDLVKSLIQGGNMVQNYASMKEIESTMLLAKDVLSRKKYYKLDNLGNPVSIQNKETGEITYEFIKGEHSKVSKRFESYLRMIYYANSNKNQTAIGAIAGNFQKLTSMTLQGLNPFSAVNNVVTAEINQRIEARGKRFYNTKHYNRANKIFAEYLKKDMWLSNKWKKNSGLYDDYTPNNKVDAMIDYFNFLQAGAERSGQLKGQRGMKEYAKSGDWLYLGIEVGEYQAQSRSAIAKMLATEVVLADGTISNVWDAHDFINGELVLKKGANFSKKDKYNVTNEIKNMNKFIHGNYDPQDKVAIQEYWLGELALQFKKWMFNSVRSRFGGKYFDEGTGMETEGRFRAILYFYAGLQQFGLKNFKQAYEDMDTLQQDNMRKNMADLIYFTSAIALYIIFDAIRDGIPEEDEKLRMALNFLKKQSDRTRGEIIFFNPLQVYQSLKNPVASLRIIANAGEFIATAAAVPYNYAVGEGKDNFYSRGINKGELKLWQKTKNLIPVLQVGRQFEQLHVSGNFFIK